MEASTLTACEVCGAEATGLLIDRRNVEFEGRTIESAIEHPCCKQHFQDVFDLIRKGQENFHEHSAKNR